MWDALKSPTLFLLFLCLGKHVRAEFISLGRLARPTNNALLVNFRLISDAEILSISTDWACKSVPIVQKRVCNVYVFQLTLYFAYHRWWLGDCCCCRKRSSLIYLTMKHTLAKKITPPTTSKNVCVYSQLLFLFQLSTCLKKNRRKKWNPSWATWRRKEWGSFVFSSGFSPLSLLLPLFALHGSNFSSLLSREFSSKTSAQPFSLGHRKSCQKKGSGRKKSIASNAPELLPNQHGCNAQRKLSRDAHGACRFCLFGTKSYAESALTNNYHYHCPLLYTPSRPFWHQLMHLVGT